MQIEWLAVGVTIGTPIIRSVLGWAAKAVEDNKITKFEIKSLVKTVIKVGTVAACAFAVAQGLFHVDMGAIETIAIGGATIIADKLFGALQENKNITKR